MTHLHHVQRFKSTTAAHVLILWFSYYAETDIYHSRLLTYILLQTILINISLKFLEKNCIHRNMRPDTNATLHRFQSKKKQVAVRVVFSDWISLRICKLVPCILFLCLCHVRAFLFIQTLPVYLNEITKLPWNVNIVDEKGDNRFTKTHKTKDGDVQYLFNALLIYSC